MEKHCAFHTGHILVLMLCYGSGGSGMVVCVN